MGGFAGGGADADAGVIGFLDEGGEDGGFAFVYAADDGELWRRRHIDLTIGNL